MTDEGRRLIGENTIFPNYNTFQKSHIETSS